MPAATPFRTECRCCARRRSGCSATASPTNRPRSSRCWPPTRTAPRPRWTVIPAANRGARPARASRRRSAENGFAEHTEGRRDAVRERCPLRLARAICGRSLGASVSGHNRWTKIKRKKEAMGASKGALFTKLIREVTVAARTGGGDPDHNARLRSAVLAAREANMPNDTITRAIKKGTGELEGVAYEEMTYEGYGPAGVALVVEVLTDNKNRTAGDVRAIFAKSGGAMGAHGSVAFQFDRKGIVPVKSGPSEDQVVDLALDAGAEDVVADDEGGFEVRTEPAALMQVHKALEGKLPVGAPKMVFLPKSTVQLSGDAAERVLRLIENLEENDDVQHVYANFEMDEGTIAQLESRA